MITANASYTFICGDTFAALDESTILVGSPTTGYRQYSLPKLLATVRPAEWAASEEPINPRSLTTLEEA